MDLDSSSIEVLQETIRNQFNKEQWHIIKKTHFTLPFIALPVHLIETAFDIAAKFEFEPQEKYFAIQLYNHFIFRYIREVYRILSKNDISKASWNVAFTPISKYETLYFMSCLQMARRMHSSEILTISTVQEYLSSNDPETEYTKDLIYNSQFFILKKIKFNLPFVTPVECIEVLLTVTGLKEMPKVYEVAFHLLDIFYLNHDVLYSKFYCNSMNKNETEFTLKKKVKLLKSKMLFLGATITLCTMRYFNKNDLENQAKYLAKISDTKNEISDSDISEMSNILFQFVQG